VRLKGKFLLQVSHCFWFIRTEGEPVDLKEDPEYKDRVIYSYSPKICHLRISGVRESDSAVYKFRFITNHQSGRYIGEPGVRLTVREILEGRSVTLTCSSDANPAAKFNWFKKMKSSVKILSQGPQFVFDSIQSTDSGDYYCKVQNYLVQFLFPLSSPDAPKNISVSVNPPEILEGSSVTLTCSSDANPAANYTWFKAKNRLNAANVYHLPSININDSGIYRCKSENKHGWINSSVHIDVLYPTSRHPAEDETEIQYATVTFTKRQEDPLYSNIEPVKAKRRRDAHEDKEDVVYSLVGPSRSPAD
uniref:Ig-like domain-containing protein n=1 Tax=Oryzias melastigma TaxID=30732 RepID=A0A3B3DD03_ORYME